MAIETRADVTEALAALGRAGRSLVGGASLDPILTELVDAAAHGTGADLAAVWLPDRDGTLVARAVQATSGAQVAELEGARADSTQGARDLLRARLGGEPESLSIQIDGAAGGGVLELVRTGVPFEREEIRIAALAADLAGLATRVSEDHSSTSGEAPVSLELVGDALAAAVDDEGASARVARLASAAAGAESALVWGLQDGELVLDGRYGQIEPDDALERAASAIVREQRTVAVHGDRRTGETVSVRLGQPALGALQLRFPPGRAPDQIGLDQIASFAVRAAHALRSARLTREAGAELERSRALLGAIGEAISRLSLAHTLDTAVDRVADLLDLSRVAVYLRDDGRVAVGASRGVEGPHDAVAEALLAAALASRQSVIEVERVTADDRFAAVRAQAGEAGIDAALAVALVVADDPIGLVAAYPTGPRPLRSGEPALLTALAAQIAVAVQNARLHEDVAARDRRLEAALDAEQEKARHLHAQHEISRSFAHSLSLQTTLDVLASSIVELLGVDAAVIRVPDERGLELIARAIAVNDEYVDEAARALFSRPQPLPRREALALLERSEALLLDAEQAEELGGAPALLAPFLRRGSSAAIIPIATPVELLATLTIVSLDPERPVGGEIAGTALAIAGQAALAIDNARLYGQQKAFADTMQRSLLPREAPTLPGLELGDVYESAARMDVGGDVYDYLILGDGRLAVVLGDVTGHGVDAAADMAMAKYVFRSLAREHVVPGAFLSSANDVVASEIAPGRFITMLELVLDAAEGEVACASAGHPPPRLVLPDGSVEPIAAHGLALGIEAPQEYETVTAALPPGGIVVAYTDGVVEARRAGEQFGVDRLDALLAEHRLMPPGAIALAALAACRRWADDGELKDDFAVVVIKRSEPQR